MRSPETDWDTIYFRIRISPMGPDFPRHKFLRTPISVLRWVIEKLDDMDQVKANMESITSARMADMMLKIAHGFSGSKKSPPNTKPTDFLPFPEYRPPTAESDGPSEPTKFVLTELIRSFQIPMHVYVALNNRAEPGS